MNRWIAAGLLLVLVILAACGGGGGGSSLPSTVNVVGNLLWIETGAAPNPPATVRIGDVSVTSDEVDGYFSIDVPPGNLTMTVTYVPPSGPPVVRTFALGAVASDLDLGDVYIGPEEVTVTGNVVDSQTSAPVPGATVRLAGRSTLTGSNGQFTLTNVAYSSNTQSVFLGLQGEVEKTGYFNSFFSPPGTPIGGIIDVGTIQLVPQGSSTPPPLPYNVSGSVSPAVVANIQVLSGTTVIRETTSDPGGLFTLWLPAGTYTVNATSGALTGTSPVTVTNVNSTTSVQITLN